MPLKDNQFALHRAVKTGARIVPNLCPFALAASLRICPQSEKNWPDEN
jgi:hypothetical protein